MPIERVSHVGICVADLERSLHLYRDALGFRERSRLALSGEPAATLLGLPGVRLQSVFLERDGLRLELLHYASPEAAGGAQPAPMNRCGLTHLSLRVADLDASVAALEAAGARRLATSRIELAAAATRAIFLVDPDGTRLELVEAPGDPAALPGA